MKRTLKAPLLVKVITVLAASALTCCGDSPDNIPEPSAARSSAIVRLESSASTSGVYAAVSNPLISNNTSTITITASPVYQFCVYDLTVAFKPDDMTITDITTPEEYQAVNRDFEYETLENVIFACGEEMDSFVFPGLRTRAGMLLSMTPVTVEEGTFIGLGDITLLSARKRIDLRLRARFYDCNRDAAQDEILSRQVTIVQQ
jgi:hypothetical protein